MNEEVIFGLGGMGFALVILTLITVIAVVVISQVLKTMRAKTMSKAEIARDEAYRKLAEECLLAQKKLAEDQQQMMADLTDIKDRVNAIEKMLREVG